METINISEIRLKKIKRADVAAHHYKPKEGEPILIQNTIGNGNFTLVFGTGVNLIKELISEYDIGDIVCTDISTIEGMTARYGGTWEQLATYAECGFFQYRKTAN